MEGAESELDAYERNDCLLNLLIIKVDYVSRTKTKFRINKETGESKHKLFCV